MHTIVTEDKYYKNKVFAIFMYLDL